MRITKLPVLLNKTFSSHFILNFNFAAAHTVPESNLVTACQRSCGKVMFSVVSVRPQGDPMWPLPMMQRHVQTCLTWTSLHRDPPPRTFSNLFKLDLTVQGPRASPDMFKLIHYEACMVGNRAVSILPECFLVYNEIISCDLEELNFVL